MAKLFITSYHFPSCLCSLCLFFVWCVKLTRMSQIFCVGFFVIIVVKYMNHQMWQVHKTLFINNIFLVSSHFLCVSKTDQKEPFNEFLCLFCFLGWSLGFCILLGTHLCFILKRKYRAKFRNWSRDMKWTACLYLSVYSSSQQSIKQPHKSGSSPPFFE